MSYYLTKPINVPLGSSKEQVFDKICKQLRLKRGDVKSAVLHKQSVDARDKSNVRFVCSFVVQTDKTPNNAAPFVPPVDVLDDVKRVSSPHKCVVVGAGPSGLFAALYLAKSGVSVTLVERGSDIDERSRKVNAFWNGGELDENCNVQFGLGGAGAFSDGKLTCGGSSPLTYTVFSQFVRFGAEKDILTDALPHVGTDKLATVLANFRNELLRSGVEILFDTTVSDLVVTNGAVTAVEVTSGNVSRTLTCDFVLLACGNGARDMFHNLVKHDVNVVAKPFAVGLRIEHTRRFIDTAQYGELFASHRDLGSASYKLVNKCDDGRGCYSFCMCPGGVVVPSCSERETVVVNGMSNYDRAAPNSNSALVVTVSLQDFEKWGFGSDCFAGVRFQEQLERQAYKLGGGNYVAPCQNSVDFCKNRLSTSFAVEPSCKIGVKSADLFALLPQEISRDLAQSLEVFDKRIRGFCQYGVLTGVETRTSSPVKILRDNTFQSNITNLYPVGEGAGYAGGIVSASVDGLRVAMAIADKLRRL